MIDQQLQQSSLKQRYLAELGIQQWQRRAIDTKAHSVWQSYQLVNQQARCCGYLLLDPISPEQAAADQLLGKIIAGLGLTHQASEITLPQLQEQPVAGIIIMGEQTVQAVLVTAEPLAKLQGGPQTHPHFMAPLAVTQHPTTLLTKPEYKQEVWQAIRWLKHEIR